MTRNLFARFAPQPRVRDTHLYECGICGGMHPWSWDGDCRDDANRYLCEEDYAERNGVLAELIVVSTMDERLATPD